MRAGDLRVGVLAASPEAVWEGVESGCTLLVVGCATRSARLNRHSLDRCSCGADFLVAAPGLVVLLGTGLFDTCPKLEPVEISSRVSRESTASRALSPDPHGVRHLPAM